MLATAVTPTEEIVVTGYNEPTDAIRQSASISTIDTRAANSAPFAHIEEVLVQVPGANFARGSGIEYLPSLRSPVLVGASGCGSVTTLVNGVRVSPSGFCNINELFVTPYETAERLEVWRGSANPRYGSNAMLGLINVVDSSTKPTSLKLTQSSLNRTALSVALAPTEQASLSLTAIDDGGFRADSDLEMYKAAGSYQAAGQSSTTNYNFFATTLRQETAGYIVGDKAYADDSIRFTNPNPEAYRNADYLNFSVAHRYELSDEASLHVDFSARSQAMDFLMHFLPGQPNELSGFDALYSRVEYNGRMTERLGVAMGFSAELAQGYLEQTQALPTQGSAFLQTTIPAGKQYDYEADSVQTALYGLLTWQSEALSAELGGRLETIRYRYDNLMNDGRVDQFGEPCGFGGCRYTRPSDRVDEFSQSSINFGANYAISPSVNIRTRVSTGFRMPQATELYRLQRGQIVADLAPEKVDGLELGVNIKGQNFSVDLVGYILQKSDVIYRDANFYNQSGAKTDHHGVELAFNWLATSRVEVNGSFSHAKHVYADAGTNSADIEGNLMDSAPRSTASLALAYALSEHIEARFESVYVSDYFTEAQNQHLYEGHLYHNLNLSWQVSEQLDVMLKIVNLSDVAYADRADYTIFSGDRYFPGRPRYGFLAFNYVLGE